MGFNIGNTQERIGTRGFWKVRILGLVTLALSTFGARQRKVFGQQNIVMS
jgi:hypothetical protein